MHPEDGCLSYRIHSVYRPHESMKEDHHAGNGCLDVRRLSLIDS